MRGGSKMLQIVLVAVTLGLFSVCSRAEVELLRPKAVTADLVQPNPLYFNIIPGPLSIMFHETTTRFGAPCRIALSYQGNICILLDHIPYNTKDNLYEVTVDIPDFSCDEVDDCQLVVQQMDTSESHFCNTSHDDCVIYTSTALVSIRSSLGLVFECPHPPTPYISHDLSLNLSPVYQAELLGQASSTVGTAIAQFFLVGQTLIFNISITKPFFISNTGKVRIVHYQADMGAHVLFTASFNGVSLCGSFQPLTYQQILLFVSNSLYVDITTSDGEMIGKIVKASDDVPSGVYGIEIQQHTSAAGPDRKQFSSDLMGRSRSVVKTSTDNENTTRFFGAVLKPKDSCATGVGGTGALNITGTQIWFQIDLHNVSDAVTAVELIGPATAAIDLTSYWWGNNSGRGMLDVDVEMQQRIVTGLASFAVSTRQARQCLTGTLEEGFIAYLGSAEEVPPVEVPTIGSGTVFLYFTLDGTANIEISLNNLTSQLIKVHLHAPAYPGNTSPVRFDMSYLIGDQMHDGSWHISAKWKNITAESLRFFQEGLYYFNMHTTSNPNGELRGQLSVTGSWHCPSSGGIVNQCYWVHLELSPNVSLSSGTQTPYGVAGVIIDRVERFQYSVALWYMPPIDIYLRLMGPNGTQLISHVIELDDESEFRDNVREAFFVYPSVSTEMLSEEVLSWMEQGLMWFNVTTADNPKSYLNGSIPSLERNRCTQPHYTVPVGGDLGWTTQTFFGMRQLQWDALNFTFSSPDNVELFDNQNRYIGCQFGDLRSTLLASPPGNNQTTTYYFNLTTPKVYYFGSDATCLQGTKVNVTAIEVVSNSDIISPEVCDMSTYAATKDQRYVSSGGSNVVAAVIVGLLLGIILVIGLVALQVFINSRRASHPVSQEKKAEDKKETEEKDTSQ